MSGRQELNPGAVIGAASVRQGRVWKWERIGEAVDLRRFRKRMSVRSVLLRRAPDVDRGLCILVIENVLRAFCVTKEAIVWMHLEVLGCYAHSWNVRDFHSFAGLLPCSLSHQDNYTQPQVDSYVCQMAAYYFVPSARRTWQLSGKRVWCLDHYLWELDFTLQENSIYGDDNIVHLEFTYLWIWNSCDLCLYVVEDFFFNVVFWIHVKL